MKTARSITYRVGILCCSGKKVFVRSGLGVRAQNEKCTAAGDAFAMDVENQRVFVFVLVLVRGIFWPIFRRYDFGITAWNVLDIKKQGQDGVSDVYVYLASNSEVLGILVACVPLGGVTGGLLGGQVLIVCSTVQ